MDFIRLLKIFDRFVINTQKFTAKTAVKIYFPIVPAHIEALIEHLDRGFMPSKQIQTPTELLEIISIGWVEHVAFLKKI
jgi:hypothetical protein